jgi:hypothetical protein
VDVNEHHLTLLTALEEEAFLVDYRLVSADYDLLGSLLNGLRQNRYG